MTDIDRYTAHYDGDLRIFLHQLCEISAILGTPYDGAFDLAAGRFDWNRGAVLHAGPGRRSVLVVTDQHGDVTLARLIEFCMRCSIRMGFHGKSKLTMVSANWRLRPSPPAPVESST